VDLSVAKNANLPDIPEQEFDSTTKMEDVNIITLHSLSCFAKGLPKNPRYLRLILFFFWVTLFELLLSAFFTRSQLDTQSNNYDVLAVAFFICALAVYYPLVYLVAMLFRHLFRKLSPLDAAVRLFPHKYAFVLAGLVFNVLLTAVIYGATPHDRPGLFYYVLIFIFIDMAVIESIWLLIIIKLLKNERLRNLIELKQAPNYY
jgi:hypothetical protein